MEYFVPEEKPCMRYMPEGFPQPILGIGIIMSVALTMSHKLGHVDATLPNPSLNFWLPMNG
jgi:hypothetical protein